MPDTPQIAAPLAQTQRSPIVLARAWLEDTPLPSGLPLINVSQAAPMAPPPKNLRTEMARIALEEPSAHLYGPVLGLPELRAEIAALWSKDYQGAINATDVAITAGCNQAFTATLATLAQAGDEVILPTPWYFNHKMACDMAGVTAVPLATGADLLPDLESAARLITPRTRAIVLVTPNNPGGVEYPAELLTKFYLLAKEHQIALVVDETYRDFDGRNALPHFLFKQPDWRDTFIHLYSFSKAFRLTGHRVGAIIADPARLLEAEKYLDTVAICPAQIGQHAALWGLRHLQDWKSMERAEILARRAAVERGFDVLAQKGWALMGCGAFFAYVRHPFDLPASALAQRLLADCGVLLLPGTFFMPEGDPDAESQLRIAFANVSTDGITQLFDRLAAFTP